MSIIEVEDLNVRIGSHHILQHVSFTVEKGAVTAIIGPNGSGKTTLVKVITGLQSFDTGTVKLFGTPVKELGKLHRKLGYVPQKVDFDRSVPLTVEELLNLNLLEKTGRREKIAASLDEIGAGHLMDRKLGVLSGGEFQRVLIALSLIQDPEILILDEPSAGIDVEGEKVFYDMIEQLAESRGMTVLLVSHDVGVVYRYADGVLCLNQKLVCSGTPHEALSQETVRELYGQGASLYDHVHRH
ncbi:MAG: metal ABC transporter ATP-binding protein [Nitrospirota bacterium]|nr:metal ABC transporter ATP-binding protein [Nitrospirota bacterium]